MDKFKLIFLNKFQYYIEQIKENNIFKKLGKYIPFILIILFLLYIFYSITFSEINIFNLKTLRSISLYLVCAFFISPIFILLTSLRFHFIKLILANRTTLYKSLNSVLLASSLDAFTPAKINDFARLKNEPNKKLSFYAIFFERILDISVLLFFVLYFINKFYVLIAFIFITIPLTIIKSKSFNSFYKFAKLFIGSILITFTHWFIAFRLFKNSFRVILQSLDLNLEVNNLDSITINKFSIVTILSVLPFSFGGIGIREASSISIFKKIDSSIVFGSALAYGLGVSGSITLIGILYVIVKSKSMDGILNNKYALGRKTKRSLRYRLWRRGYEVSKATKLYLNKKILKNEKLKILDLGCADGLMIDRLSKEYKLSATGIELSKELYERAKINCPTARIINSDINELDNIKDEKFDLIICTAVLEHLEYPEKTVSNIYSLLSENGITVWTVPDPFWEKIATSVGHLDDDQHHHIPNIRELKELAKSNNLKVIEAKKFMFSPIGFPLEIIIERILRKLKLSILMANQLVIAKK